MTHIKFGIILLAIVIVGFWIIHSLPATPPVPSIPPIPSLGAISGPDIYNNLYIHGTLTTGGRVLATSTSGSAVTLTKSDLENYDYISFMSNVSSVTMTLPATSTMLSLLKNDGDVREWIIHNATTTAATTLTIAVPTGIDLVAYNPADRVLDGGDYAELKCMNLYYRSVNNEDIVCKITELGDAD